MPLAGSTPYALLAQALTPLFAPLGLGDWRLVGALVPGFVAKEVVVGALGVSFLGTEAMGPLGLLEGSGPWPRGSGGPLPAPSRDSWPSSPLRAFYPPSSPRLSRRSSKGP